MNEVVKRCSSCLGFYEVTRKRCDCGYIEPERGPRCFETVAHFHLLPFEDAATRAQIAEWDARVPAGEDHEIIDTGYWKKTQSAPYEDDENVATAHKLIFPHGAICVGKERPPAWKCETPRLPKHDDKVYDEPQTFEDVEDRDAKEWDVPVGAGATPASFGKRRAKVRNWKNWQRFLRPVLEVPGFQRWTLRTPHRPLHISAEPAIEIENRQRHAAMRWEANERAYIMEDLIAREWSAKDLAADPYTSLATIYNIQYETPEPQYPVDRLALIVAAGGGYSKAERLNDARWVDGRGVGDSSGKSIDKRWVWETPRFYDLRLTASAELLPHTTDQHQRRMLDWQASWTKERGNVEVFEAKVFAEGRVPVGERVRLPVRVELTVESLPMPRSAGGFFRLNPIVRVLVFRYWSGHFWHVARRFGWVYTATSVLPDLCSIGAPVWTMPKAVIEWYTMPVAVEMVGDRDGYPDFVRPAVNPTKHMLEKQAKWAHVG